MWTVEEALERVLSRPLELPLEELPIEEALGRYLGTNVHSRHPLPLWDNSAMDGYAVRSLDCSTETDPISQADCDTHLEHGNPKYHLNVVGHIAAGSPTNRTIGPGECMRIMTGAPVPSGADAILIQEHVSRDGNSIASSAPVSPGQNIRKRGEELRAGETVLGSGTRLNPGAIGLCASLGITTLPCYRTPRIGILATGDELRPPGTPLDPGTIWSSNTHSLSGLVTEAGARPIDLGIAADSEESLSGAIERALGSELDILITTGGVSVGDHDLVKEALARNGMNLDFWKIRMKPGKPLAFGRLGTLPVFGLPGNPVSCMVGFLQFVRPFIRRSLGDQNPFLPVVPARFEGSWTRRPGRNEFLRVSLHIDGNGLKARITGRQGSARVSSMALARGFALIGHEASELKTGDTIHVQLLSIDGIQQPEVNFQWHGPTSPK